MQPIRTILVPLDGSPFSEHALPWAMAIAERTKATVHLAQVHHPVPAYAAALEVPEVQAEVAQQAEQMEREYLEKARLRAQNMAEVPVTTVLLDGPVAQALAEHARAINADLMVMTTHGRGPVSRFWLGSVADQLLRQGDCPLLLIRPGKSDEPGFDGLRHILVPVDGSAFAEQGLELAVALGRPFNARYTLLFVVEPPLPVVDGFGMVPVPANLELDSQVKQAAERYTDRLLAKMLDQGLAAERRVEFRAGVADTILEVAGRLKVDVIALATHGAGGARRLLLGSVADKVIRGSDRPVLVQRAREAKPASA